MENRKAWVGYWNVYSAWGRPGTEAICTFPLQTDVTVCHCKPVPGVHYRVNFKDLPFLLTAVRTLMPMAMCTCT